MLPLIGIAASFIPDLIRLIGSDKTNTIATKVTDAVSQVTQASDEAQVRAKLADPAVAAQLQARLAEIALDAQKAQNGAEASQRQNELDELRATLADTHDARSTMVQLADKESPVAWGAQVVSVIIGLGFFTVFAIALFGGSYIKDTNKEVVYTLIGAVATAFATMVSFWLGSSQGSRNKDETVRQLQLTHAQQTSNLLDKMTGPGAGGGTQNTPAGAGQPAGAKPIPAASVQSQPATSPAATSNFVPCLHEVLHLEGGFSDDPRDPGGPTNFGITRAELAQVRRVPLGDADVTKLTLDEAEEIYHTQYWNATKCDDLAPGVDLMVFHFAVNAGNGTSVRVLQNATNSTQDGIIGPKTLAATGGFDPKRLITTLAQQQMDHYRGLATWQTYGTGWTNRVNRAQTAALAMVTSRTQAA